MIEPNPPSDTADNHIRVLIVDDHAMVRTGLKYFLRAAPDLELVGEATNGQEAVDWCAHDRPDVVLMDLVMPGGHGAPAIQIIHKRWPRIKIIALTNFHEAELVQEALQAGAIGYLLKNISAENLAGAIRAAHNGLPSLAPEATQALITATAQPPPPDYGLTSREHEVLVLLVKGLSNAEIAGRLVINLSTAKFHVSNILAKLGVSTRAEAVALAWERHLVA